MQLDVLYYMSYKIFPTVRFTDYCILHKDFAYPKISMNITYVLMY